MVNKRPSKRTCILLLMLLIGVTACKRTTTAPRPMVTVKDSQTLEGAFSVTGWTYCLCPINSASSVVDEESQAIWNDLFARMAKDGKTRELLTQLHGGWPTVLAIIDASQIESGQSKAPPPDGISIVLRVADLQQKDLKTNTGEIPIREIAFSYAFHVVDAEIAEATTSKSEPIPGDALDIAIEEFVLREAPAWVARRAAGPEMSFEDDQLLRKSVENLQLPASIDEQRRELALKIEKFTEQAKMHYGALPTP